MHPGAVLAGVGAIDALIVGQASYALRRRAKDQSHPLKRNGPPKPRR